MGEALITTFIISYLYIRFMGRRIKKRQKKCPNCGENILQENSECPECGYDF
ncbi:zinc-ribbon domain-containing protein [Natrinema limicola]|uniref:Zinc-ribbon domain-containing protein n=1 Tax=Natrinema limicola JCM 13563 TaxID=1230457 RepID=M0C2M6_9EURY|nr:hypothetical protein C476_15453 [Natrinema limicola JCM 13563]